MRATAPSLLLVGLSLACPAQEQVWEHLGGIKQYRMQIPATTVGDLNGDGMADIVQIVHRFFFTPPGFSNPSTQLWFLSGADGRVLRTRPAPDGYRRFKMVAAAGDVDGDGVRDYACTHYPGVQLEEFIEVASGRDDRVIYSVTRKASYGWGIGLVGDLDVDGDGRPDLVITGPTTPPYGEVVVVSGTGRELYTIRGDSQFRYEFRWRCVDKLGDFDGDGADDFVVGVLDAVRGVSGAAVHSGRTGQRLLVALADQWPQEAVGAGVAGAGDLDGDGKPDFFASSHGHAGERGLVIAFSSATGQPIRMWWGARWGSGFGTAMRSGVDLDRDGVQDLAIAHQADFSTGRIEVYSGRDGVGLGAVTGLAQFTEWMGTLPPTAADPFPSFFGIQPMYESYWWREINAGEERGRTRLYRSVPAGVKVAGNGCPGTLGMTSRIGWRVQAPGARVHLSNAPAGAGGVLLVGLSDSQWGPFRLPLITDPYGLPGCTLHTSVEATVVATTGTQGIDRGYAYVDIPQPLALPNGGGVRVFAQWLVVGGTGIALSERVEWWIAP